MTSNSMSGSIRLNKLMHCRANPQPGKDGSQTRPCTSTTVTVGFNEVKFTISKKTGLSFQSCFSMPSSFTEAINSCSVAYPVAISRSSGLLGLNANEASCAWTHMFST